MNERKKHINEVELTAIIKSGTTTQLYAERHKLIQLKQAVVNQLSNDQADARMDLASDLAAGAEYGDACRRVFMETDHDWRARAAALVRIIDAWLIKIKCRLNEITGGVQPKSAVVIAGAARSASVAANALNALIQRGCFIVCFAAIDDDLVIVASEPTKPAG